MSTPGPDLSSIQSQNSDNSASLPQSSSQNNTSTAAKIAEAGLNTLFETDVQNTSTGTNDANDASRTLDSSPTANALSDGATPAVQDNKNTASADNSANATNTFTNSAKPR